MGEEIKIELPDSEPETENEGQELAETVIANELAALRQAEAERTAADILAAAALAQAAHELAQSAHDRIDDHGQQHVIENVIEAVQEPVQEETEIEPEPESEPEPEQIEDKKPQREHWFYR